LKAMRTAAIGMFWTGVAGALVTLGCSDQGDRPTSPGSGGDGPRITGLVPARTLAGDTVRGEGAGFGAAQDSATVLFATGGQGTVAAAVVPGSWSDAAVRVLVPEAAVSGPVTVLRGGRTSAGAAFAVAPEAITFADVLPILGSHGCTGCHGNSGGLSLESRESILAGGIHGPAALPRRSGQSNLVRKVGPNPPFGERMPAGSGPYLTPAEVLVLADWIDQGARGDAAPPPPPPPPPPAPQVQSLLPARTVVGDTVVVRGERFGDAPDGASVLFTGAHDFASQGSGSGPGVSFLAAGFGGAPPRAAHQVAAEIVPGSWSDTEVRVLVPEGAADGEVVVARGGASEGGAEFRLAPRTISYRDDLIPLFLAKGCISCHGGTQNLYLDTPANARRGDSAHGPVVRPRRSAESLLVQILGPTNDAGLPRMPYFSTPLADADIRMVADWIDQGARDN